MRIRPNIFPISSLLLTLALLWLLPWVIDRVRSTDSVAQTAGLASLTNIVAAQTKHSLTFEDLMAMKRLGETAISPDGKWLAYSVTTVDLVQNTKTPELWLQAIAGGQPFKLATGQPGDSDPKFSADGKRLLWISRRESGKQIWVADFDAATGAASNARKLTALATEADSPTWSPDGKSIMFTSSVYPGCPVIGPADGGAGDNCNKERDKALADSKVKAQIFTHLLYRHWDHYTGEKRSHLFLVSADTGAMRDLNPGDPHDVPPFSLEGSGCGCDFSPDSKELAFTENLDPEPAISTNTDIFTLDLTNPAAKPVKVSKSPGGDFNPAYSPDGKYLAWRSQARAGYESDRFRLVLFDREKKTIKDLLENFNFDDWVDEFSWVDDSQHILFVSSDKGEAPVYEVNVTGDDLKRSGKAAGAWSSVHMILIKGFPYILGTLMRVDRPAEVALGNALNMNDSARRFEHGVEVKTTSYEPPLITHLNDALLAQLDLPKMEPFWFTGAHGDKVQGFLVKPPNFDLNKKYPVKFLIHGGPQGAWGDDWSYRWNPELFAASGYVVVMINFHGSTGYGQKFIDAINGDWGGAPFEDLMKGLDYAEQHYPFIDKDRECALGASYGGYMANWVLGHTDRFKCIVSHDGMFNAESAWGTTEELWFNEWEFKGTPYTNPKMYEKWSPRNFANYFKTPTLVIHGQLDYRLDVSEGLQLFTTLQRMGVPSKMLYFPDEGHWVLKPQNSQLWYKTVNDWVDQWIGDKGTKK